MIFGSLDIGSILTAWRISKIHSFEIYPQVIKRKLPEHQRKHCSAIITASQHQRTIMQSHYLTRKTQSDDSTFLLGREEWNEDRVAKFLFMFVPNNNTRRAKLCNLLICK